MTLNCSNVDGNGRAWGKWHAIYETRDGKDYCREDAPESVVSVDAAKQWAEDIFELTADSVALKAVGSYRLEKW